MFSFRSVVRVGIATAVSLGVGFVTQPSPAHADIAAPAGWITGVVLDGNGDPVEGALVNAVRPSEVPEAGILAESTDRRTWTGTDGAFRVRQAAAGYLVQICHPEPADNRVCKETAQGVDHLITYVGPAGVTDSWVPQTSLFEGTEGDRDLGEITVKPQSFIHGTLKGARFQLVQLLRLDDTVAYRAQTDAEGDYRFRGLAPGSYRVSGGGNGFLPWRSSVVTVGAGGDAEVDGRVRRGARIEGILTSAGRPVSFTDVLVRRAGGDLVAAATTNRRGVYHVSGLVPGDYRLGILYDGSDYQRKAVTVAVPEANSSVTKDIRVREGAVIVASVFSGGKPVRDLRDELRDESGRPILGLSNDGNGQLRYAGLSNGTYTLVAATDSRYVKKRILVRGVKTYDLGRLRLDHSTFSLSGTTAPKAVVEAMTGDQCLPDGPDRMGAFHLIERADAAGHYEIDGLVPGRWMLGSDGWPFNYVPRCVSEVRLTSDTVRDLPLEVGGTVSGRLVYAATGTPVITTLSYELTYPYGSLGQPTDEHPSRAKSAGATGLFFIDALGADTVTGQLSPGASDDQQINNEEFFVIYPAQDGTPYYLTSEARSIDIVPGVDLDLGDIDLVLHGAE